MYPDYVIPLPLLPKPEYSALVCQPLFPFKDFLWLQQHVCKGQFNEGHIWVFTIVCFSLCVPLGVPVLFPMAQVFKVCVGTGLGVSDPERANVF